jgi:electron transfer flavoprotein beta subunit
LNIVVCVKHVPDTETRIRVDGASISKDGVKFVMSPYDEFALEGALQLKEAQGSGSVTVVSYGGPESAETLRRGLAMGADQALLLKGEPSQDGLATAKVLADAINAMEADLVLLGVKAADDDQQQVGPMLGVLLDRPCASAVTGFEVNDGAVQCRRSVEGGTEVVRMALPAVLTISKGDYDPRLPSLKGIMAAKRKPLEERDAESAPSRLTVERLEEPQPRPAGKVVGEGAAAVPELVRLLREEAKVL